MDRAFDPDREALAAGLSGLLARLAHTPEAELGPAVAVVREGDRVGRFELRRELGRGGMGVVWEAEDPALARRVALKLLRAGTRAAARGEDWLRQEAEAVARLGHPAIVTLHDHGTSPAGPFLVFERLHGLPLDRALRDGPLPLARVLEVGIAVAGALDHAHRAGVIHRDLKPSNVFLQEGGGVKVLDFGLASLLGRAGPGDGGTPAFMAPEQWRGEPGDGRTDLFALGVTLWNALTGRLPFAVEDGRSAAARSGPAPRLPREVGPQALRALLESCLARDPAARPASAREVVQALERIRSAPARRARQRRTAALAVAALAGLAAAGWTWWGRAPAPGDTLLAVVADPRNETGLPALDDLSRLLTTALEQSRRLAILTRPQLAALARQARFDHPDRLDSARSLDLARLGGARVLLLPEVRKDGAGLRLLVRAVDPADGHPLFDRAAVLADPAGLLPAVDEVAVGLRERLHERREDLAAGRVQLAGALSPNLEAVRAYYQGIDCWSHPAQGMVSTSEACPPFFAAALAADPGFAMAHHWLARIGFLRGSTAEAALPHVSAALAAIDRLPAREALLVRSWAAHVAGRNDEALAVAAEALVRFPGDLEALEQGAAIAVKCDDFAGAVPYLERLVELEAEDGASQVQLAETLAALDRREALERLVARLEARASNPSVERALNYASIGLGRADDAIARARARFQRLGTAEARRRLLAALNMSGRFGEGEPLARAELAAAPDHQVLAMSLAFFLAGQGRLREALRVVDEAAYRTRSLGPETTPYFQAMLLTGNGDREAAWRAASRCLAASPDYCSGLAVPLALSGDLAHAARLAVHLPGGAVREQYEALVAWRAGHAPEAIERLRRQLEAGQAPTEGMAPAYLLAEVNLAAGDPAGALAAIDRFRRTVGTGWWSAWAQPRSALLAARAHLALGRPVEAKRELDTLLAGLGRADADLPLLLEARALRGQLGAP